MKFELVKLGWKIKVSLEVRVLPVILVYSYFELAITPLKILSRINYVVNFVNLVNYTNIPIGKKTCIGVRNIMCDNFVLILHNV